jgi:excisionase family DNA binding protein
MSIIEQIEQRSSALKVGELAALLQVTPQHIYKLASAGQIPFFRVEGAIRLDPQEIAGWLRDKHLGLIVRRRTNGLHGRTEGLFETTARR